MMQYQRPLSAEEICQKLKPIFGEKIDKIYFSYVTAEGREAKEEMFSMLNALYQKHFDKLLDNAALLVPPKKSDVVGEYTIGNVCYGKNEIYPFNLREKDFPRHVCISGMSGSGKTTLAFNILEGLIKKDKPFLVFDWKKSFRPLLAKDAGLTCFTVGDNKVTNNFKLNINMPPKGVSPKEWITVICDLIAESFFVSYGVHKVLLETLDESFKEWGIYSGSNNYPTWNHIKWRLEEKMNKAKSREQGWIESAMRVATVLTFGDFGEVVNYKGEDRVGVEDILDSRVIFEMNSLGNIEKKFFCEFVLMYIYKLKKAKQNSASSGFDYAILVDEAHNIFLKDKTRFVSESVTDMIYREMREYGISLICLDQHISKLSDTVKGNSACHIAFQQQLPEDIDSISRLMHLYEQKDLFSRLDVGTAVVKLSDRYTKPFFVKAPFINSRDLTISNEEIKGRVQKFLLGNEFVHNVDLGFKTKVVSGGEVDLSELFKKINLPKTLSLRATEGMSECSRDVKDIEINKSEVYEKQFALEETKEETAMSETIFASIKRRVSEGEDLNIVEKELEAVYEPSEVNKAMNRFMEERLTERDETPLPIVEIEDDFKIDFPKPQSIFESNVPDEACEEVIETIIEEENISPFEEEIKTRVVETKVEITESENILEEAGRKVYKESLQSSKYNHLDSEESKFITFLNKNPSHKLTTVNLYKSAGFSPRKGNKIKNQLIEKNLLMVEEIKYDKGWKKIIRLKNSNTS